nr:DNA-directed DNA polymerase [Tanacetum cinerariifolium]
MHCVPKKRGFTLAENEDNELIPTRLVSGWRVCIDYCKLNEATQKDHFPLPFMDQMLQRLAGNQCYYFLDDFSGTFQRCMMAIFHDMIEKTMEVFMDDFSVFENSFQSCLSYLERMLKRCEDTNLCLNWEESHFMVKEGIVLGHKISKQGIEVDKEKVNVITKLPHPTTVKGIRIFFGHADFYRRFIKDFSKIARPMIRLLEKDTPFIFSQEPFRPQVSVCKERFKGEIALMGFTSSGIRLQSENRASWSDKLDDALWAFHTTYKIPIGCTPYKIVYEKACHLPVELEHKAY